MPLSKNDFTIIRGLGSGSFGSVFKATKKNNTNSSYKECVLKKIYISGSPTLCNVYRKGIENNSSIRNNNGKLKNMTGIINDANKSNTLKELRNEINILKDLEHDNIIKLYDWYLEQDSLANKYIVLVMEYASGGDLKYLKDRHNNEIPLDISRNILEQILNGLDYLHTNNVIHRDLKLENILISDNNPIKIKIADFGLAKIYNNTNQRHSISGTPGYIHENIQTGAYGKYVDYRAFGSIMYLSFASF